MREPTLRQPLVTRPAYGEGNPALPKGDQHNAQSGLPEGGPSNRGIPLDSGIPGYRTFVKTEDATTGDPDKHTDESKYRIDNADDLLKNQDKLEVREDNADKHDGIGAWGQGESDPNGPKTRYPYRDQHRNTMMASRVLCRWLRSFSG